MKATSYGLLANAPVQWLLAKEPDVKLYVEAFIRDEAPRDYVDVAGPPDIKELAACRLDPRRKPLLPLVRLSLRKVEHLGQPGISVTCSAEDADKIVSWHQQARLRAALPASRH